ncbi:zinc ribbon domain-containing protein [Streptomyces sp. NPDC014991]|uniref:zinc ribbon domain-containing protein n=1 Tax=Streptomyces sp. NPDC014991 TaxID=3364935 RepID=UPI0036FF7900
MHFCVHCGARVEDAARPDCPHCGAPYAAGEPAEPAGRDTYLRVGATRLPGWLPWALVAVLAAGGVALGVAVAGRPDTPSAGGLPTVPFSPGPTYDGSDVTSSPYDDGNNTAETYPADSYPSDDSGAPDTGTPEPTAGVQDARTVVLTYYDHLNAGNYSAAWDMGGSHLFPGTYSDWVAGFATTAHVDVTASDDGYGTVSVELRASQNDGSVRVFRGTYTVAGGEIVNGRIQQVS